MIATMSQQAPSMSLPTSHQSSPKRPRLSLKIQSSATGSAAGKSTALKTDIDTTSPTAFNTLSNAYATAIENASPRSAKPPQSILCASTTGRPTSLRLVTNASSQDTILYPSQRTQTPGPFTVAFPDTPTTGFTTSSPMTRAMETNTFTFTPPSSAHPTNSPTQPTKVFSFSSNTGTPISPHTSSHHHSRRRAATVGSATVAPYTHPLSLHSILRNSPLMKRTATVPPSPSTANRSSQRLASQANKRVGYNNPLTQTITTNKYTKSHIDLLVEDASPYSAVDSEAGTLDLAMAYTGDETRDGGQTPGPFEEMRRRMAGLDADEAMEAAEADGVNGPKDGLRKRKRKEKNRQWVWTIGVNEEDEPYSGPAPLAGADLQNPQLLAQKVPSLVLPSVLVEVAKEQEASAEILRPVAYKEPPREHDAHTQEEDCDVAMNEMGIEATERPDTSHSI